MLDFHNLKNIVQILFNVNVNVNVKNRDCEYRLAAEIRV